MLDTFSSRLKICRLLTGLRAKTIVDMLGEKGFEITTRHFSRWEVYDVDTKRLNKLDVIYEMVDIFNKHGLPELSSDWLLYGKGMPPLLVDMSTALEEEKAFYIARSMGENYRLVKVIGDYAEPFVLSGEQMVLKTSPAEKLEDRLAFIETNDHQIALGILKNTEDTVTVEGRKVSLTVPREEVIYSGRLCWVG